MKCIDQLLSFTGQLLVGDSPSTIEEVRFLFGHISYLDKKRRFYEKKKNKSSQEQVSVSSDGSVCESQECSSNRDERRDSSLSDIDLQERIAQSC